MRQKEIENVAKQLQRDYMRDWTRNNPEKVKEYRRAYWERKAKQLLEAEAGRLLRPVAQEALRAYK